MEELVSSKRYTYKDIKRMTKFFQRKVRPGRLWLHVQGLALRWSTSGREVAKEIER